MLVDHDRGREPRIHANLATTGFDDVARVQRSPVGPFLAATVPEAPFDLVFLDPPYDMPSSEVAAVLAGLAASAIVAPGGTVVVERPKSGEPVTLPDGWGIEKERAYGDTLLVVAHAG